MSTGAEVGPVFVAGATGRSGTYVVKRLQELGIEVRALVRSAEKAKSIAGPGTELVLGTITDRAVIDSGLAGCRAMVIASSATPAVRVSPEGKRSISYPEGGVPEIVDYHGQKTLIDAARAAGIQHVVLISSLGATQINHPLNRLGDANILIWKYLAEDYLRKSGLPFTIVRPGGLTDGPGGKETLVVGTGDTITGRIDRADVAEVCVQALLHEGARNHTFELVATDGTPTTDFAALFDSIPPLPAAPTMGH